MKKVTMATLKKAWRSSGIEGDFECEETKPDWADNSGNITIYLDQDLHKQFTANGCTCLCAVYWEDVTGSREDAIKCLIADLDDGIEDMSEQTAYECGVSL